MKILLITLIQVLILIQGIKINIKVTQNSLEVLDYTISKKAEDIFTTNHFKNSKEELIESMKHLTPGVNSTDSIIYEVNKKWNFAPNPLYLFSDRFDAKTQKPLGSLTYLKEHTIDITIPSKFLNEKEPKIKLFYNNKNININVAQLEKQKEIENEKQEVITILQTGTPRSRICLVYLSSGYRSRDRAKFIQDIRRHLAYYKFQRFYRTNMAPNLNIYGVFIPSNSQQWGCRHDNGWWCTGSSGIRSRMNLAPKNDMRYVLVNDARFAGAATFGGYAVGSNPEPRRNWQGKLAVHELGHMYFRLHDEYNYERTSSRAPTSPNCHNTNRNPPWRHLIGNGGVGTFRVCGYSNWFRATQNCLMNNMYILDTFDPWCLILKRRVLTYGLGNTMEKTMKLIDYL